MLFYTAQERGTARERASQRPRAREMAGFLLARKQVHLTGAGKGGYEPLRDRQTDKQTHTHTHIRTHIHTHRQEPARVVTNR